MPMLDTFIKTLYAPLASVCEICEWFHIKRPQAQQMPKTPTLFFFTVFRYCLVCVVVSQHGSACTLNKVVLIFVHPITGTLLQCCTGGPSEMWPQPAVRHQWCCSSINHSMQIWPRCTVTVRPTLPPRCHSACRWSHFTTSTVVIIFTCPAGAGNVTYQTSSPSVLHHALSNNISRLIYSVSIYVVCCCPRM